MGGRLSRYNLGQQPYSKEKYALANSLLRFDDDLDSFGKYVDLSLANDVNQERSWGFSLIFLITDITQTQYILGNWQYPSNPYGIELYIDGSTSTLNIAVGATSAVFISHPVVANRLYRVFVYRDNTSKVIKYWINGIKAGTNSSSGITTEINDSTLTWWHDKAFRLGSDVRPDNNRRAFKGNIGALKVFNFGTSVPSDLSSSIRRLSRDPYIIPQELHQYCVGEWDLNEGSYKDVVFEFETSLLGVENFDPAIIYSGEDIPKWVFEDGSELFGSSISTLGSDVGLDGSVQKVELHVSYFELVTSFVSNSDGITGNVDFNVFKGATFSHINLSNNNIIELDISQIDYSDGFNLLVNKNPLTNIQLNPLSTAAVGQIDLGECSLSSFERGNLIYDTSILYFNSNTALSFIELRAEDTLHSLNISGCSFTSLPNLGLVDFVSDLSVLVVNNQTDNLFAEPLPTTISGKWKTLNLSRCSYLDLDVSKYVFADAAELYISGNQLLTSIIYPEMNSGYISRLHVIDNPILNGYQDISGVLGNPEGVILFYFNGNNYVTGVSEIANASEVQLGAILRFSECNLTGTLDLSGYKGINGYQYYGYGFENNPNLTGLVLQQFVVPNHSIRINGTGIHDFDITTVGAIAFDMDNSYFSTQNCNLTAAEVNKYLNDCLSVFNSGFVGRNIFIGGNNAAPDATSGGIDGLAAKTILESRGVTVTTS